jgi:pyridoxamine 5'-phosphate oxidase
MSLASAVRALLTLGRGVVTGLPEPQPGSDPFAQFRTWFDEATHAGILMPEAMTLATATRDGIPSARMVLLKGFDTNGFVFFTNYESRKANELEQNPRAALCFHWTVLQRQVRIEGDVSRVSHEESEAYFRTRARASRIGAWASLQSRRLDRRATLDARVKEFNDRYPGEEVPLPPFWGGYRVTPLRIEFWQGRAGRLHDRLVYTTDGGGWKTEWLYP